MNYLIVKLLYSLAVIQCSDTSFIQSRLGFTLIDKNATFETQVLYNNLKVISKSHFLYGHQDDLAYGVGWWHIENRSDIKDVCGSYPAVFGWDLGKLGNERNIDSVLFSDIRDWIIKTYEMGMVNTISWHMDNPVSKKDSWDVTQAVSQIIPGGKNHAQYKEQLRIFAKFNDKLVDKNGTRIPLIFRPFHEHNGSWFWWGKKHCTKEEYILLWQFTVNYLRDSLQIHNLIYCYSPDGQFNDYLDRYPGDDYVDILGLDFYFRGKADEKQKKTFSDKLISISKIALQKGKLATLSETGYESIPEPKWHTEFLLHPVKNSKNQIQVAYMLCWRNANKKHHFAPYPGHKSTDDFNEFYNDPYTLFEEQIKNIYTPEFIITE